ncbi:MAG TPA: DUF1761 domain-containing protein [bacterium]|nr:DUF1761 domain-containing protein [bacterium]
MAKKVILGTIAYTAVTFILGATWHFVLFKDLYAFLGAYNRHEPIIPLGFISMFLQGMILSFLFQYVRRGTAPIREGLLFSYIMGLFMYTLTTIAFAAKTVVSSLTAWFAIQAAFHLIQFTLVGLLLGVIFGRKRAIVGNTEAQ